MEIGIIQAVQSVASPNTLWGAIVDNFMLGLSFFGETAIVIITLFVIYWCFNRKLGEYLLFCVFTSSCFSFTLKNIVKRPRPIFSDALRIGEIRHVKVDNLLVDTNFKPTSYSFPSGHVTNAGTLYMGIASYFRVRWLIISSIAFTLLLAISRIYLGVHYPSDTLVGFMIASLVCWGIGWLYQKFYSKRFMLAGIITLVFGILSIFFGDTKIFGLVGAGLGYCVCAPIEERFIKFEDAKVWWKRILRFLVGLACAGVVFLLSSLVLPLETIGVIIIMALVVGSAVLLAPYLFKLLKL